MINFLSIERKKDRLCASYEPHADVARRRFYIKRKACTALDVRDVKIEFLRIVHKNLAVSSQPNRVFTSDHLLDRVVLPRKADSELFELFVYNAQSLDFKVSNWTGTILRGFKWEKALNGDNVGDLF